MTGISRSKLLLLILLGIGVALLVVELQFFFYPWAGIGIVGIILLVPIIIIAWLRPYWWVLFLTIFIPLESFVLKFVPGPEQVYALSQFYSEFLIYLTFSLVVLKLLVRGKALRKTPIDIPLAIFIVGAVVSIVINHSPWIGSLTNLRSVLRYVVLFYLIINLDLAPRQINRLIIIIISMGALEVAVGFLQIVGGGAVKSFFLPRVSGLNIVGRNFILVSSGRELGSIFGTLGDTLYLGLFMLLMLAVYLGRIRQLTIWHLLAIGIVFTMIGFSYSRAALFGMLIMLFIWYICFYRPNRAVILIPGILFVILTGFLVLSALPYIQNRFINPRALQINIIGNITSVFSKDYFELAKKQRLGSVLWIPPVILKEKPVFGYGPDQDTTIAQLNQTDLPVLYKTIRKQGFEDVYWVAILSYYGLVGLTAIILTLGTLLIKSWKTYHHSDIPLVRSLAITSFLILILTPFLLFFYRALEFRAFSFYLWLLPALMLGAARQARTAPEKQGFGPLQ